MSQSAPDSFALALATVQRQEMADLCAACLSVRCLPLDLVRVVAAYGLPTTASCVLPFEPELKHVQGADWYGLSRATERTPVSHLVSGRWRDAVPLPTAGRGICYQLVVLPDASVLVLVLVDEMTFSREVACYRLDPERLVFQHAWSRTFGEPVFLDHTAVVRAPGGRWEIVVEVTRRGSGLELHSIGADDGRTGAEMTLASLNFIPRQMAAVDDDHWVGLDYRLVGAGCSIRCCVFSRKEMRVVADWTVQNVGTVPDNVVDVWQNRLVVAVWEPEATRKGFLRLEHYHLATGRFVESASVPAEDGGITALRSDNRTGLLVWQTNSRVHLCLSRVLDPFVPPPPTSCSG